MLIQNAISIDIQIREYRGRGRTVRDKKVHRRYKLYKLKDARFWVVRAFWKLSDSISRFLFYLSLYIHRTTRSRASLMFFYFYFIHLLYQSAANTRHSVIVLFVGPRAVYSVKAGDRASSSVSMDRYVHLLSHAVQFWA